MDTRVTDLKYKEHRWIINKEWEAKRIVNTVPWNDFYKALGEPAELLSDFDKIKYNRLMISLYEKAYEHDWHWRYIPDAKKIYHREFYVHNFALDSKEDGVYLESNLERYHQKPIRYDGKLLYETETEAAYPIPVIGHRKVIGNILGYYRLKNLFGVGRWGQHQYQNADVSMYGAIKFVEGQVKNCKPIMLINLWNRGISWKGMIKYIQGQLQ